MVKNALCEAVHLSAGHYGTPQPPGPLGKWSSLVRIVLEPGRPVKVKRDWSWIAESSLATARDAVEHSADRLVEDLESAGCAGKKAGLLRALARWWQHRIAEEDDAPGVFRSRSVEHWQNELRSIRGVSWELADRILLFVGGCSVYPLDRASMRIAQRHGWMDAAAEYGDWQALFGAAARDSGVDLTQLRNWNVQLGRDFCGQRPDCEACPLRPLLPAYGPVPFDDEQ